VPSVWICSFLGNAYRWQSGRFWSGSRGGCGSNLGELAFATSAHAALAELALRFLHQSVIAGLDIARRALDPRLPLRPGFVIYPVGFPPGPARNMFTTLMSLLPGTVPTGSDEHRGVLIHCLDVEQPVIRQLAAEEDVFARVIAEAPRYG